MTYGILSVSLSLLLTAMKSLFSSCLLLLLAGACCVSGFFIVPRMAPRQRASMGLRMGIDVSGLTMVPLPAEDVAALAEAAAQGGGGADFLVVQNLLIIVFGTGYLLYEGRPRGSAREELLEIRRSTVTGANLGVFASKLIPQGTVIGAFPGYVKNTDDALKSKSGDKAKQQAKQYMWALSDDVVLDPTNEQGVLELQISLGPFKVDTMMARINEPPRNGDCNVYTSTQGTIVQVIAERDIFSNEELFMDYGQTFDRTAYDSPEALEKRDKEAAQRTRAAKQAQEDAFMRLQPIVQGDDEEPASLGSETSNPDGFIGKLAKNEAKFKKAGIISPEEGAELFAELGTRGMVASTEDRDLIQSLSGKADRAVGGAVRRSTASSPEEVAQFDKSLGKGMMDSLLGGSRSSGGGNSDKDLLEGLRRQMGAETDDVPDLMDTGLFGGATGNNAKEVAKQDDWISVTMPGAFSSSANADDADPEMKKAPLLSQEEAAELQGRLDNLSDEQIEEVFARLRSALGDKMKDDLGKAIQDSRSSGSKGIKAMPRAQSVDPAMRTKYATELNAIEDELEKIYSDPLGVWQELMANPDKYGGGPDDAEGGVDETLTRSEEEESFQ